MKKAKHNGKANGSTDLLARTIVEVPHPSYQPTAKELSADLRLKGTFEDGIAALVPEILSFALYSIRCDKKS